MKNKEHNKKLYTRPPLSTILRVGFLLGKRQIEHASKWTNALIIFIMTLTFLNLVGVSGILVGLIEGSVQANKDQYTGDVIVSTPPGESYIERSAEIIRVLETNQNVDGYSARLTTSGTLEANFRTRRDPDELRDQVGAQIAGIDPVREDIVTNLSDFVVEGEYLDPREEGFILIGSNLIARYAADFGEGFATLEDVFPGDVVRLTVGDVTKEVRVKGVIDSKVNETSLRVFMSERELGRMLERPTQDINEISILVKEGVPSELVREQLTASGLSKRARIRTFEEAIPTFLEDIKLAFGLLGNIIGSIGIVVASITIFIIIFINAITRRKYIGILKGIGINSRAIEFSYVMQSIFYAFIGSALGSALLYGLIIPAVARNPIDFPFSDGILVAPPEETFIKFLILLIVTILAGFIPARMIIKKNTLDSILGR